jgi:hypothetical protein
MSNDKGNIGTGCPLPPVNNEGVPEIKLLDVVALKRDRPDYNLKQGETGTVVHVYTPDVFEVEFSDEQGRVRLSEAFLAEDLTLTWVAPQ